MDLVKLCLKRLNDDYLAWKNNSLNDQKAVIANAFSSNFRKTLEFDFKIQLSVSEKRKDAVKLLKRRDLVGEGPLLDIPLGEIQNETVQCESNPEFPKRISREQCLEICSDGNKNSNCEGCEVRNATRRLLLHRIEGAE